MITTCTRCGSLYEAGSEEQAYEPARFCFACRQQVSTDEAQPAPQGASGKPQTGTQLRLEDAAVTKSGDSRERPAIHLDWIRDCVAFTEKNKRLSEALCVLRGYEVSRRYTDAELSDELAEVAIALVSARAVNSGSTQG